MSDNAEAHDVIAHWRRRAEQAEARLREYEEALREACLHQGLPENAEPARVAAHFRRNREYREGWAGASAGRET